MPSTTEPQARFMAACAHGADYESCPPAKVSKEFNQADKGSAMLSRAMKGRKRYQFGGEAMAATGAAGTALNQPPQGQPNLANAAPNAGNAGGGIAQLLAALQARTGNQPQPSAPAGRGPYGGPSGWTIDPIDNWMAQQPGFQPGGSKLGAAGGFGNFNFGGTGGNMQPTLMPSPPGGAPPQAPNLGMTFGTASGLGSLMPSPPMPPMPPGGTAQASGAGGNPQQAQANMFGMPGRMMAGAGPAPGVRPPMAPNLGMMGGLGQLGGFFGAQGPRPMPAPAMRPPIGHPGMMRPMPFQGMRGAMARGGQPPIPGAMPTMPGQMPGQMMRPPSPLQSLISGPMAGRHAGFPGARKPRIPLPGSLRNINQMINRSKERLGSFPV